MAKQLSALRPRAGIDDQAVGDLRPQISSAVKRVWSELLANRREDS